RLEGSFEFQVSGLEQPILPRSSGTLQPRQAYIIPAGSFLPRRYTVKRIVLLVLIAWVLVSTASADQWKRDYAISGKPEVRLSTGDGSVEFMVWDRKQVSVSVYAEGWQIGSDGIKIEEHQTGDRVEVTLHIPQGSWCMFCNRSIHVDVSLPRDANIDFHTG